MTIEEALRIALTALAEVAEVADPVNVTHPLSRLDEIESITSAANGKLTRGGYTIRSLPVIFGGASL